MQRRIRKPIAATPEKPVKRKKHLSVVQKVRDQRVDVEVATSRMKDAHEAAHLRYTVMEMKERGLSHYHIAEALGIDTIKVTTCLRDALEEYYADRDDAVKNYLAIANARYDRIFRTWMPLAEPRIEIVEDEDGNKTEIVHKGDPEAARIVLTAMRDAAKMMGLNKIRVEHTGKDGAAINVDVDFTSMNDEQLAKFAETGDLGILRSFAGAVAGSGVSGNQTSTGT